MPGRRRRKKEKEDEKRKKQEEYRKQLELQMQEVQAAKDRYKAEKAAEDRELLEAAAQLAEAKSKTALQALKAKGKEDRGGKAATQVSEAEALTAALTEECIVCDISLLCGALKEHMDAIRVTLSTRTAWLAEAECKAEKDISQEWLAAATRLAPTNTDPDALLKEAIDQVEAMGYAAPAWLKDVQFGEAKAFVPEAV